MPSQRPWLEQFPWQVVTALNAVLCQAKNALHRPTSDGHDSTKAHLGADAPANDDTGCSRRCHKMAPFCFYNDKTFASIIALVVKQLDLPSEKAFIVRSLAGHIVAGVATAEEVEAFRRFSDGLS
jgi:hypothetical protein